MSDQLQINIGADTKGLETGLQKAVSAIDNFDKEVQSSAKDLQKFSQYLPNIAVPPSTFKAAEDGLKGLGSAVNDTGNKLKGLPSQSGQATLALSNLGRIASDAPFGFIAISNNIEPLVQSLQSLGKTSGGIGGTLKALGASLIGPGGLLLGFSLVSSAITVAVQKYGSLGNAINAIFGRQDALVKQTADAAKSYEKFNQQLKTAADIQGAAAGSTAGEAAKVQALAKIVQDQTKTYSERNTALKELQSINKTYFGDIDLEKGKLDKLTTSVEAYTQATIQSAITKAFESEIGATTVELDRQQRVLDKLRPAYEATSAAIRGTSKALPGLAQAQEQFTLGNAAVTAGNAFKEQETAVNALKERIKELNSGINSSVEAYNKLLAPQQEAADAAKIKAEQDKKAADAATKQAAAQGVVNTKLREYNDLVARQEKFKARLQTVDFVPPELPEITIPAKISAIVPQSTLDSFNAFAEEQRKALDTNTLQLYAGIFSDTLAPAIDAAFGALANGTSAIDAIKNSLKGLLAQLAANAAKALLFKAALSFIPGLGTAGAIGGGGILQSLLGGNLLGGIGGAAAPRFSGTSALSGGLQLAGQVVFTQRGTDLVGVLNSSNARIGRVG
jgi:hypothetical protein